MEKKKLWVGMLAVALVFGMTVVGCGDKGGDTDPHKITITGLGGKTGDGTILLYSYLSADARGVVAGGQGTISGGSLTASLQGLGGGAWAGSGQHHILVEIEDEYYAYTNGQTLDQLGISSENDFYTKMPKYNITGSTTTIGIDKFLDVTDF
jgi:hypothetical protein